MQASNAIKLYALIFLYVAMVPSTTYAMNGYVLALAGDIGTVMAAGSTYIKKQPLGHQLELGKHVPPSVVYQIYKDADTIYPYVPYLVAAPILSCAGRFYMISQASGALGTLGTLSLAGISIPLHAALITSVYAARLYIAYEQAGIRGKTANLIWEWSKK